MVEDKKVNVEEAVTKTFDVVDVEMKIKSATSFVYSHLRSLFAHIIHLFSIRFRFKYFFQFRDPISENVALFLFHINAIQK